MAQSQQRPVQHKNRRHQRLQRSYYNGYLRKDGTKNGNKGKSTGEYKWSLTRHLHTVHTECIWTWRAFCGKDCRDQVREFANLPADGNQPAKSAHTEMGS